MKHADEFLSLIVGMYETSFTSGQRGCFRADLDCGHTTSARATQFRYICGGCGDQPTSSEPVPDRCSCGYRGFRVERLSEPLYFTKRGDLVHCRTCETEARDLERLPGLVAGSVYSRARRSLGGGYRYTFYASDKDSPTGVRAIGGVFGTPEVERELDRLKVGPLSPTEGLAR